MEEDEPIRISVTDVFDLHTVPPRDVAAVVDAYLDEAHAMGLTALRIIHGKGTGALRQVVDEMLRKDTRVREFHMGSWNEGGAGVTIAVFA